MTQVRKGNRVYSIDPDDLDNYLKNGWEKHSSGKQNPKNTVSGKDKGTVKDVKSDEKPD